MPFCAHGASGRSCWEGSAKGHREGQRAGRREGLLSVRPSDQLAARPNGRWQGQLGGTSAGREDVREHENEVQQGQKEKEALAIEGEEETEAQAGVSRKSPSQALGGAGTGGMPRQGRDGRRGGGVLQSLQCTQHRQRGLDHFDRQRGPMRACCKGVCQVGSERNVVTQVAECQRSCYSTVASLPQVSVTAALFALEVPSNVLNAAVGVLAELQTHAKVNQSEGPLYVLLEEAIVAIRSSLLVLGVCRSHILRVVGALALLPSQPGSIRPIGTSILSTNPW